MKPVRPCIERGCPAYTTATRCETHQTEFEARRRADPTVTGRRGSSPQWKRLRLEALTRDLFSCRICGVSDALLRLAGRALEVHHIDGNANNNDLSNLMSRCPDCHHEAHAAHR